jgi:signal transduction histidine kinase
MLQPIILLVEDVIDQQLVVGEGKPHLDIVLDCCRKARQIIRDMLAFSRPTASNTEIHDPVVLLHDSLPIVRQALPPDLAVTLRIEDSLPLVRINRTTFVQILLNLAINAAAAMNGQGELTIALEQDVRGPEQGETGQPTRLVRLLVIDKGFGMDQATLDRAFEPFFTTKPIGQGTGLGLPVVSGLLRAMGATIGLASEPGCGTTVTILIPGYNGELDNGVDTNS